MDEAAWILLIGLTLQILAIFGGGAFFISQLNAATAELNRIVVRLDSTVQTLSERLRILEIRLSVVEALFNITPRQELRDQHPKFSNTEQMSLFEKENRQSIR